MHEAMIAMKSRDEETGDEEGPEYVTEATKKRNAIVKALNEFLSWRFKVFFVLFIINNNYKRLESAFHRFY